MKYYYIFCLACIAYGIYLFSYHLLLGDLLFHTDIARDFLLIQDIAINHKLALIGPRAGGIQGIFFGPIWLYLNLPAFLIGNGNPLVIGYFWFFLILLSLAIIYYVAKKVFGATIAIFSTAMFLYSIMFLAPGFTQSFGQVVVSPILLYSLYLFIEKKKVKYLCWAAFMSGLLIQFQPAFGSIMLFVTFMISLIVLIKRKRLNQQLVWFIAVLPLFTYVVFELRHNFLETYSFFYFISHHRPHTFDPHQILLFTENRFSGFLDTFNLLDINNRLLNGAFLILNVFIFYRWFKSSKSGQRTFVMLAYLYVICFWLVTFLFNGTIWNYYYWGLYPFMAITLGSLFLKMDSRVFLIFYSILLIASVNNGINTVHIWRTQIYAKDTSSWIVNKEVADYIFTDAHQDFGYYVYSPDVFGYSKKYAMSYVDLTGGFSEKGYLCTKKPITYLIYEHTGSGAVTNPVFWKNASVSIKTKPVAVKMISTVKIEKYELTPQQVKQPSDPTMICGLQWR